MEVPSNLDTFLKDLLAEEEATVQLDAEDRAFVDRILKSITTGSKGIFVVLHPNDRMQYMLLNTNRVAEALQRQVYAAPALPPAAPWLGGKVPGKPLLQAAWAGGGLKLDWRSGGGAVWQWVLQKKSGGHWSTEILAGGQTSETINPGPGALPPQAIALFAVDRFGNLSSGAVSHGTSEAGGQKPK